MLNYPGAELSGTHCTTLCGVNIGTFVKNTVLRSMYRFVGCRAVDDMNADILKYYTTGVDAPLCPALTHVTKSCDAACVHQLVDDWLIELPDGKTTLWQVRENYCTSIIPLTEYNLEINFKVQFQHRIVL